MIASLILLWSYQQATDVFPLAYGMHWSRSLDPSSGVVSGREWVPIPVMTLVPMCKAHDHNCLVKVGKEHSALQASLLVGDYHAFILTDCGGDR